MMFLCQLRNTWRLKYCRESFKAVHISTNSNSKENISAVLHGIKDLRLEARPIPKISNYDVITAIDTVGICESDVHYWNKGKIGKFILNKPMIIGHEASGVVCEVGKKVKHLKVGDRVAIEPGTPCRKCTFCKAGKYNLCPDMVFCSTPPYDGILTKYYKHPADFCYQLPDHVTMEEGVLIEPLAIATHACKRAGISLGSEVLILGCGPIGLSTLLIARAMGASNILITDYDEIRLEKAKELCVNHTFCISCDMKEHDIVHEIHKIMGSIPDKTIDCMGVESSYRIAVLTTRSGGCGVLIGLSTPEARLPLFDALAREVDIRGIFRYCNDYRPTLAMVSSGQVDAKPLVTHHFDMTETVEAFETAQHGDNGVIKVLIHVQPRDTNNKQCFCNY